ncbi:MAG: peptide-methionine (S)-S-oxide reductase MsrA [Alphaproteobacteria bacterium]|nr:peptide-methionine (S)-S-oxide reductase MsrA [Alphaproteobacteria bacterium]
MQKTQKAIFSAGCFWGVEEHFRTLPGVQRTEVGYIGGHTKNPDYKQVCRGDTEHVEAVRIVFDADQVCYADLLAEFWRCHDPTQKDRQGLDVGRQYRSAIFVYDADQRSAAENAKASVQSAFSRPIVSEILPATTFYTAEDYHQFYIAKRCGLV